MEHPPKTLATALPCGMWFEPDESLCWRVWAPRARRVELVLDGNRVTNKTVSMHPEDNGYFRHREHLARDGLRYAYRLNGGPPRPDPATRWQPEGVHKPSAVFDPHQFEWSEAEWSGIRREDLVIYELHVGTFTPQGTFEAIIPRLNDLRELGVTAIELMPVAQFPGERNWGYDGVQLYAVQNSYGGPHGLQQLVNAAHRAGLGVILDVVFNHLGPEGNYLAEFGPYFTDRYHTPWGPAFNFDGRGSDAVRDFVLENVRQWIRDYRVDGLRLDAVQAIYDFSPFHILHDIHAVAIEESCNLWRPLHLIAESNLNDVRLLNSPVAESLRDSDPSCGATRLRCFTTGGFGLDAMWNDDFHHCVHSLLTGERHGYYADFGHVEQLVKALNQTFVYDGCFSVFHGRRHGAPAEPHAGDRFVISIQNHDQVGNRARGDRFGTLLNPAQQRLAAGLLLLAPYVPLLFMGEEYGETRPFPYFCSFMEQQLIAAVRKGRREELASLAQPGEVLDPQAEATFQSAKLSWSWPEGSPHEGLRRLYHDLLAARRSWPALRDFLNRKAELVPGTGEPGVLRLTRGSPLEPSVALIADFNLSDREQHLPRSILNDGRLLFSSEDSRYGGQGAVDGVEPLRPFEVRVCALRS